MTPTLVIVRAGDETTLLLSKIFCAWGINRIPLEMDEC